MSRNFIPITLYITIYRTREMNVVPWVLMTLLSCPCVENDSSMHRLQLIVGSIGGVCAVLLLAICLMILHYR